MPFLNNKLSFQNLFSPPDGYKTKFVELTTFSISLGFATLIPTLIYAGNNDLISDELNAKYIMKSKDFIESLGKFHIFYDGKTKMDTDAFAQYQKGISQFGSYILNNNAHGIKGSGLFHPKIMVFEFEKENSAPKFRVFIGSRNLTYSNYIEAGVCIDIIENSENASPNPIGGKLEEFFSKYYKSTTINSKINWGKLKTGKLYLDEEEISKISIHFSNFKDKIDLDFKDSTNARIVSMNPSTSLFEGNNVSYIANNNDLEKNENLVNKKQMAYLVDAATKNPLPLHAKIYAIEKKEKFITWIGSANCSQNGLNGGNAEVMLRIVSMTDNLNSFPLNSIDHYKSEFLKGVKYCIKAQKNIDDVKDEENPLKLPVKITGTYASETFTLNIEYKDSMNSKPELKITPFGLGSAFTKIVTDNETITFKMTPSNFTNIFQVSCNNAIYRVVIDNVAWKGVDIPKIIESIEVDPIKSIKELVPVCKDMKSTSQDAFERILAHKYINLPDDFNEILDRVIKNIQEARIEENKKFKGQIDALEQLCTQLKGESICN